MFNPSFGCRHYIKIPTSFRLLWVNLRLWLFTVAFLPVVMVSFVRHNSNVDVE